MTLRRKNELAFRILILVVCCWFGIVCTSGEQSTDVSVTSTVQHPEWSKDLGIYEVNIRQFTPSGTFRELEEHLPRIKELGIGIVWLMPIHPIGEKNRKGSLGSYYSVKDYLAVNPEYGTLGDFKHLVSKIHELGMYVIIDWVPNHTSWDNTLAESHPEWYHKDESGNFRPPVADWADVIHLDYGQPGLREYMINTLKYWVRETDIDGFRCDVAHMIPVDFWDQARAELDKVKPVFMLAEAEGPQYHFNAFDMTYGWEMHHIINLVAQGKRGVGAIDSLLAREATAYPPGSYRMQFTSNHDENSWAGTVFERMGDAAEVFAVFCATVPDMPLIYGGQEAGLDKRLQFFEKDQILWREHRFAGLYKTLLQAKKANEALWNGPFGDRLRRIENSQNDAVFSFTRGKDENHILVLLNLSSQFREFSLSKREFTGGAYQDLLMGHQVKIEAGEQMSLRPWQYRVLVQRPGLSSN
jgi:1,4-alpha-glucan branching enzyme